MPYYSSACDSFYSGSGTSLRLYDIDSSKFPTSGGVLPVTTTSATWCIDSGYRSGTSIIYVLNFHSYTPTITQANDSAYDIHPDTDTALDVYCNINDSSLKSLLSGAGYTKMRVYYAADSTVDCGASSASGFTDSSSGESLIGHWFSFGSADPTTYYRFKYFIANLGFSLPTYDIIRLCSVYTGGGQACCSSSQGLCSCATISACNSNTSKACSCSSASSTGCVDALTKILLPDGKTKFAKDVKIGDLVMSYVEDKIVPTRVQNKYFGIAATCIYKLILEDKTYLFITERHPIATAVGYRTIEHTNGYATLAVGDSILTVDGYRRLDAIIKYENNSIVYNFLTTADNFIANNIVITCEDPAVSGQFIHLGSDYGILKGCQTRCNIDLGFVG